MDRIGSYGLYNNNYYNNRTASSKSGAKAASEAKESGSAAQKKAGLSDNAKKLLKELQKSYSNTDFIVADYANEEEAASYLSKGTSKYSVLMTPEELEKMAADEKVKAENLKTLDNAFAKLEEMKQQLGDKGQEVSRLGVIMGSDGEVSFFAELEKVSEKQRERIEERRENNREEARKAAKDQERVERENNLKPAKRTVVHASSVEELLEKIGQVDWDQIPEPFSHSGNHFNLTV